MSVACSDVSPGRTLPCLSRHDRARPTHSFHLDRCPVTARRPLTTLLPYRAPAGAAVMSAVFRSETTVTLAWAIVSGARHRFAELLLFKDPGDEADAPLQFDLVRNPAPGLETYDWVRRLRAPAYSTARRSRES